MASIRIDVFLKHGGHCGYCGSVLNDHNYSVDHIIPTAIGGRDSFDNLMPCCKTCNSVKNAASLETFRERLAWRAITERVKISIPLLQSLSVVCPELLDRHDDSFLFYFEKPNDEHD